MVRGVGVISEHGPDLLRLTSFPAYSRLHWPHNGRPPVPATLLYDSMLLPVVQDVLLWCTSVPGNLEWNADVFMTLLPSTPGTRGLRVPARTLPDPSDRTAQPGHDRRVVL